MAKTTQDQNENIGDRPIYMSTLPTYPTADLPALIAVAPEASEDFIELHHPAGTRYRVTNTRERLTWFAWQLAKADNACKRQKRNMPARVSMTPKLPHLREHLKEPDNVREFVRLLDAPLDHVAFGSGRDGGTILYTNPQRVTIEGFPFIVARDPDTAALWFVLHDCGLSVSGGGHDTAKDAIEAARAALRKLGPAAAETVAKGAAKAGHTQQSLLAQYLHTGIEELI